MTARTVGRRIVTLRSFPSRPPRPGWGGRSGSVSLAGIAVQTRMLKAILFAPDSRAEIKRLNVVVTLDPHAWKDDDLRRDVAAARQGPAGEPP